MDIDLLSEDIINKRCTIVELMEGIKSDLTSSKAELRASAVGEVVKVLQKLPVAFLNEQEVSTLVEFLCLKLSDHFSVSSSALGGLHSLCGFTNLSDASADLTFRTITMELQIQTLNQKDRWTIYQIFRHMLRAKLQYLKTINHDFVFGFIQSIDAEKDPRNLVLVFEMFPEVVAQFDISRFVEDLFEVVACYFPIDFTPSASGSVTRDQLVQLHMRCLSASPQFAEFLIPLLLEKLSSDLRSARLESFRLLALVSECYPARSLLQYGQQLLAAFRRAMFRSAVSDDERMAALAAFSSVASRVGRDAVLDKTAATEFFELLLKECRPNLRELDPKVMEATGRALEAAVAAAGGPTRRHLIAGILPDVLNNLEERKDLGSKCGLLEILRRLLDAALSPPPPTTDAKEETDSDATVASVCLSGQLDRIQSTLYGLATTVATAPGSSGSVELQHQLRLSCLTTLGRLCSQPELADAAQRAAFDEHLLSEVAAPSLPRGLVRPQVRQYAQRLGAEAADLVTKGFAPLATEHVDPGVRSDCLLLLGELADLPEPISGQLLRLLLRLCLESAAGEWVDVVARLEALRVATETCMQSATARPLVIRLWAISFTEFASAFDGSATAVTCAALSHTTAAAAAFGCLQAFARGLSASDEASCAKSTVDWTVQAALAAGGLRQLHCAVLFNLAPETARQHALTLMPRLFERLFADATTVATEDSESVVNAFQLYASLVNKCLDYRSDPTMAPVQQRLQADVDAVIAATSTNMARRTSSFIAWTLKALLLSGSPLFAGLAARALDAVRAAGGDAASVHGRLGTAVANQLDVLLTPCKRVLCVEAKAAVNPLAAQKCLCLVLQPLLVDARTNESCLLGSINLAKSAPPDLMVGYVEPLMPALMLRLRPPQATGAAEKEEDLRVAILRLLECLTEQSDSVAALLPSLCLTDLLPRLLACLDAGSGTDMTARISAARLLHRLAAARLAPADLLPHRTDVLGRLGRALDDPKRLVRGEAVRARNAWYLVGSA